MFGCSERLQVLSYQSGLQQKTLVADLGPDVLPVETV